VSSAHVGGRWFLADRMRPSGPAPQINHIEAENALELHSAAIGAGSGSTWCGA